MYSVLFLVGCCPHQSANALHRKWCASGLFFQFQKITADIRKHPDSVIFQKRNDLLFKYLCAFAHFDFGKIRQYTGIPEAENAVANQIEGPAAALISVTGTMRLTRLREAREESRLPAALGSDSYSHRFLQLFGFRAYS